jgi:hypothetical protein
MNLEDYIAKYSKLYGKNYKVDERNNYWLVQYHDSKGNICMLVKIYKVAKSG